MKTIDPPRASKVSGDYDVPQLPPALMGAFEIYLDGIVQRYVVAFDIDAGWLVRCSSRHGERFIGANGDPAIERVEGSIETRWR